MERKTLNSLRARDMGALVTLESFAPQRAKQGGTVRQCRGMRISTVGSYYQRTETQQTKCMCEL
jgi:hypothetical protein